MKSKVRNIRADIHRTIAYLRLKKRYMPRSFTMLLAAAIGFATGFACVILKYLIKTVSSATTDLVTDGHRLLFTILPVVGLGLTTLFCRKIIGRNLSRGTDRLISFLKQGGYILNKDLLIGPIIANTLTLGFGGSAGAEGPIATTGSAIGNSFGRVFGLTPDQLRMMIGCGAGAGIAAIFKAPVGGMLFTLEILRLPFTTSTVLALLLSCLASAMTCYICTGFTFDVFLASAPMFDADNYIALAVFGLAAGIYSLYYVHAVRWAGRFFGKIGNIWIKVLAGGLSLGILLYFFPALYGEGYGVMDKMLNGDIGALYSQSPFREPDFWAIAAIIAGLLLTKAVAVGITTYVGVAGDFAPTLFAGSLAGLLFASVANSLGCDLPVGDFALIGMCAVFAGVIRAPFMAMFLTPEMTGNFTLFLPMVIASALSYAIVRLATNVNYYHEKIPDRHL